MNKDLGAPTPPSNSADGNWAGNDNSPAKHLRIGPTPLRERVLNWLSPDALMCLVFLNMIGLIFALRFDDPTAGLCFFIGLLAAAVALFVRCLGDGR